MASFLDTREKQKTFEEKISKLSKNTQHGIHITNQSFDKFCKAEYNDRSALDVMQELKLFKGDDQITKVRAVLQNWIDWQYQNNILTSTIKQRISRIKNLFRHNGIKIHFEDFDEPLEFTAKIKEELHELTYDEIESIFKYAKPQKKGFYLALISTGARPGELLQVRKKDIDITDKRIKITIRAENVKTRSGRSVWLTKEAASYLMPRLKRLGDNDLVWTNNPNENAVNNEGIVFSNYVDKAGLGQRYEHNNYRKITLYSFRSFFFGKAADIHREGYAHRMTGHGGYLPQYDRMSNDKKLDWFLKLEPELIIDPTRRQELKILEQQKRIDELSQKDEEITDLKQRLSDVEKILKSDSER